MCAVNPAKSRPWKQERRRETTGSTGTSSWQGPEKPEIKVWGTYSKPTEEALLTTVLQTFKICFFHNKKPIITWMLSNLGRKQKQVITTYPNLSWFYFTTTLTCPLGSGETGQRETKHKAITAIYKIDNQQEPIVIAPGTMLSILW